MKTKDEIIKSIIIVPANLEYIIQTGKINGSLYSSIFKAMEEYAGQFTKHGERDKLPILDN